MLFVILVVGFALDQTHMHRILAHCPEKSFIVSMQNEMSCYGDAITITRVLQQITNFRYFPATTLNLSRYVHHSLMHFVCCRQGLNRKSLGKYCNNSRNIAVFWAQYYGVVAFDQVAQITIHIWGLIHIFYHRQP